MALDLGGPYPVPALLACGQLVFGQMLKMLAFYAFF
jgi:hypothetical protein